MTDKPILVVTGIDADAMSSAVLVLMLDLPEAVVIRHRIDADRSVLVRIVSDITGVIEHHEIDLAHACTACAIREDVVPTLQRIAHDPRWGSVVVHLPVSAEADQLCHVLAAEPDRRRAVQVSSVLTVLDGDRIQDDLLGDALLADRGLETSAEDRRGVGEVLAAMVEFADVLIADVPGDPLGLQLVRALARPGTELVTGTNQVDLPLVARAGHHLPRSQGWANPLRSFELPALQGDGLWRVDLRSDRPFHPDRLLNELEQLGAGRHRSKGCFWLPTRPDRSLVWAGSGGQVSVGDHAVWGRSERHTRLVLTGVGAAPAHLEGAFESMLLEPGEVFTSSYGLDGFEQWLGPIRDVA